MSVFGTKLTKWYARSRQLMTQGGHWLGAGYKTTGPNEAFRIGANPLRN